MSISRFPTPVTDVIASQIGWTLLLGGSALIIAVILGNFLGIVAAWRRGGFLDSTLPPILVFLGSFPYFFLAMGALYLFGVILGWFPLRHAFTAGLTPELSANFILDVLWHLVLPVSTIVIVSIGGWMLAHAQHDDRHHFRGLHRHGRGQGPQTVADHDPLRRPQRDAPRSHRSSAWPSVSSSAAPCSPRSCSPTPAWVTSCSPRSRHWTTH